MDAKPTEATAAELLPSSLPTIRRGGFYGAGLWRVPMYCRNCGKQSPYFVVDAPGNDAYYICDGACAEKWQAETDALLVPDEVHWNLIAQEQLEREGRPLTAAETVIALDDPSHYLSKLARSRP